MISPMFKKTCKQFIDQVKPYTNIQNEKQYNETLDIIESLLDDPNSDSYNIVIELLSQSIETYENSNPEIKAFEKKAESHTS